MRRSIAAFLGTLPCVLAVACGSDLSTSPGAGSGTTAPLGPSGPSGLSYSDNPAFYVAGRPITPNVPTVTGTVTMWAVIPPLPTGLVLDLATGVISGTPATDTPTSVHIVTASNLQGSAQATLRITTARNTVTLEPHQDGQASDVRITGMWWGRAVDVWDFDPVTGRQDLVERDVVIGEDITSDGIAYRLETVPTTGLQRLVILQPRGTGAFQIAWDRLDDNLHPIATHAPGDVPPFTMVARNAGVVVRFDDLIDATTVTLATIRTQAGLPPSVPFEPRVFVDTHYGGFADPDNDGRYEVYPTRAVLKLAVTELDAVLSSTPIPINPFGLPPATSSAANALLRLPTQSGGTGQAVVTNLAGNPLAFVGNGPTDPGSPTLDVVRAFRSGGDDAGDAFNGYLWDVEAPRLVTAAPVVVSNAFVDPSAGANWILDLTFFVPSCALAPRKGDILSTSNVTFEVREDGSAPVVGTVAGLKVRALWATAPVSNGSGTLFTPFDPVLDAAHTECFASFSPQPLAPPNAGVDPTARVQLRFSEALDPESLSAFDNVRIDRRRGTHHLLGSVVAALQITGDAQRVSSVPMLPFAHLAGRSERYFLRLRAGGIGPRDLSGNELADGIDPLRFDIDPGAAENVNGSWTLRFDEVDEDGNHAPEIRGNFLRDVQLARIRPRPVTRFSAVVDRNQPVTAAMIAFAPGVQSPLSPLGSRTQMLWRYPDVGFGLLDEATFDVDVEGLAWAPVGGLAQADAFASFEIALSHGAFLPDEVLDVQSLLPKYPGSGIVAQYAANALDTPAIVHPRARGYIVSPIDAFTASTGTTLMPWPLNRGLPADQHRTYTWRDTSIQARGAPNGVGAELEIATTLTGVGTPGDTWGPGQVRSVGLPLLVEFKCFPDMTGLGVNALDVNLAIATSGSPNFRAFSTGGIDANGVPVLKNPDLEPAATGGFGPNGAPTPGRDNVSPVGQVDFVVKVSRIHTLWADTCQASPKYLPPVVDADLPAGTEVQVGVRGAHVATGAATLDASTIDAYGDATSGHVGFFNGNETWAADPSAIDGAPWFQARISFVSNAATAETPTLRGFGVVFWQP